MRRLLASILLFLLFILPVFAHDWSEVASRVERSLVRVTFTTHVCAGFVINAEKDYVLTARHCILQEPEENADAIPEEHWIESEVFQVDGAASEVVARFPLTDLLVVKGGGSKPSLDWRHKSLRRGLPVASLGFGYGLPTPTLLAGAIASPRANWGRGGEWLTLDFRSIGGMSGGPIFDSEGRVVGVTQRTDEITTISRPLSTIVLQTGKYWD